MPGRRRHGPAPCRRRLRHRCRREIPGQSRHQRGAGRNVHVRSKSPVIPGCATVTEAMVLAELGFTFLEVLPGRGHAAARPGWKGGGRAVAASAVLPDRRHRHEQCARLAWALPNVAAVWRLLGDAEGSRRQAGDFRQASPRPCTRGVRPARLMQPETSAAACGAASAAPSIGRPLILIVIVGSCASYVYWRDGPVKFLEVAWSDSELFASMLVKVLAGCLYRRLPRPCMHARKPPAAGPAPDSGLERHPGYGIRRRHPAGRPLSRSS